MLIIDIVFLAFIALSMLASAIWPSALWSLGAWSAISVPLGVLVAAVAVVIFVWQTAARQTLPPPHAGRRRWWHILIACIAALAVFWILRIRHDLWGERYAIAAAAEHGMLRRPGAPLGILLHRLMYRFMNATFIWNGSSSSALLSALAGTGFVAAVIHAARLLSTEDEGSGSGAALLVTNGFILVFFGAGGNAPLAALFSLLFIYTALRTLRDGMGRDVGGEEVVPGWQAERCRRLEGVLGVERALVEESAAEALEQQAEVCLVVAPGVAMGLEEDEQAAALGHVALEGPPRR